VETPVKIDFQGTDASPALRALIEGHVADLEERYGRVTACRVVVKAPGGRHRTGGLLDVNIRLSLPEGREVNVSRLSHDDERHADFEFAIADAFKRARRQLQDHARKLQGKVKRRVGPPLGRVVRLERDKGFGFLESDDGQEIYFHRNSVLRGGFERLEPGTRVSFTEQTGDKGPQASSVKPLAKHRLR
jgi:cold shock CspA family protein/ribosome-associated translation inhibitor RaiA